MTCTECKYQWCWLCEGEYQDGHFRTGQCNGLQFAKINYLSEKDKLPKKTEYNFGYNYGNNNVRDYHFHEEERQRGCCLFNSNIIDHLWFIYHNGPFNLYYGNKCIMYLVTLFVILFFMVPISALTLMYEFITDHEFLKTNRMQIILYSYVICMFISYQVLISSLVIPATIITLPFPSLNILTIICEEIEEGDGLEYY